MKERQQNTTAYPIAFLMVLASDHITGATGLVPTVTISKNGAAFAAPAGAVTELANGFYELAGNATDRNTLGEFIIHATAATADVVDDKYEVVAHDPMSTLEVGWEAAYAPSGDNFYAMVWLQERSGKRFELTAGATCAVAVRESQGVPDLFAHSPALNLTTDSFEGLRNAPNFTANRVYEIRFTIVNNGVTYTAVGAFPVVSSA